MVHQREVAGKVFSHYSVNYFGDKRPPKMGRCDLDCIIILFFIHLDALRVEKLEESTNRTILSTNLT